MLRIAGASVTGPATNVITGVAVGFESVAAPALSVAAALLGAYYLGQTSGLADGGLYGTAIATMGMLSTVTYVLAMDTYGPTTDNAGGIAVMSGAPEKVRERTARLDASGNTTKALTKGYAVGSAALAAFLLFSAYTDEVKRLTGVQAFHVDLGKVDVFIGALLGTMLVYLFNGTAIKAVGKAARVVILEVRRQLAADPGILSGTARPSYARCVDIVTAAALRQMVLSGGLIVLTPLLLGVLLVAEAVAGFLQVGTIAGVVLALFLNTAGGAWDNAKKHIETGAHSGKGSEAHKAAVVGDTVGDPFKDTAGPSLHVLVKLISTVALVAVSLFVWCLTHLSAKGVNRWAWTGFSGLVLAPLA